jgi:tetratricopeptide (TPR) repeat protein
VSCYTGSANTGALAAQSAIDLNPSFALGHLVLGMARLFDGDASRAVAPLRHGLTLNPNDPQNVAWHILLAYAELLSDMLDKALESANRALALRPVFGPTFEVLCCCIMALGRHDDARQWGKRLKEVDGPEGRLIEPIRANQPEYDKRIAELAGVSDGAPTSASDSNPSQGQLLTPKQTSCPGCRTRKTQEAFVAADRTSLERTIARDSCPGLL